MDSRVGLAGRQDSRWALGPGSRLSRLPRTSAGRETGMAGDFARGARRACWGGEEGKVKFIQRVSAEHLPVPGTAPVPLELSFEGRTGAGNE